MRVRRLSTKRRSTPSSNEAYERSRAVLLGHEQRDLGIDQDRGVEQHEPLDELGMAGGDLEGEPAAERVADPRGGLGADRLEQQADVLVDAPGRLVRRRAVAEQVGREHVAVGEPALARARARRRRAP